MTTPIGEGAQSGAPDAQSGVAESTGTGAEVETGSTAQSGETAPPSPDRVEADALREKMRAADQRAAKFEQELKQLRDKDLPEAEKLKRDFAAAQEQVTTLQTANNELALKVAFLEDNTYKWQNPKRAQQLIDLSQVEIGADGSVSGLKEALKALATSDPYLLKQEVKEEAPKPPSTTPGNNGGTGGRAPKAGAMAARFPALNTRVKRG